MGMYVITANRLSDGTVIYYTGAQNWSSWIADAFVCDSEEDTAALLESASSTKTFCDIVDPYSIEVYREAQTIKPVRYREAIRARGPSTHTSSTEKPMPPAAENQDATPDAFLNGL